MARMQKNNPKKVGKYVLHVWSDDTYRVELAHGTLVEQGFFRGISEIRFKSVASTMLQLQHKSRGDGRGFLFKNGERPWEYIHGGAGKRQTKNRKGVRSLSKRPRAI